MGLEGGRLHAARDIWVYVLMLNFHHRCIDVSRARALTRTLPPLLSAQTIQSNYNPLNGAVLAFLDEVGVEG